MPRSIVRPCTYPGCNTLTRNTRCDKHQYRDEAKLARTAQYDGRYRKLRSRYLAEHPVCQIQEKCNGDPAVELDHIKPLADGGDVHDTENFQGTCIPCHRWKSKEIDGYDGSYDRTNY